MDKEKGKVFAISTGTIMMACAIVAGFYFVYILSDIILAMITAVVVSSAIEPGVRFFENRKVPRVVGVLSIYIFAGLLISTILFIIIPTFLSETSGLLANVPTYVAQINNIIPLLDDSFLEGYSPLVKELADRVSNANFMNSAQGGISTQSSGVLGNISTITNGLVTFVLIIVLSFYFSVTKDGVGNFLRIITPERHEEYVIDLWKRTRTKIGAWMQGQMLLGVLIGTIIYMILAILNVKHALLLGFLAGVLEIIPVFGPTLAAVPAVFLSLLDGGIGFGFVVLLVYIVVQQFENHLFYPLVVKKMVGISPILVIISLVVGAKLGGFIGIILSVPASVLFVEFLNDLDKRKASHKNL